MFEQAAHSLVSCAQHLREVVGRILYWSEQVVHMDRRRNCQLMNEGLVGLLLGGTGSFVEARVFDRT